jgi:hypothetical protein
METKLMTKPTFESVLIRDRNRNIINPAHANELKCTIFEYDGSNPNLTDSRREEIRTEYLLLLSRCRQIGLSEGNWITHIEFRDEADAIQAENLRQEMFITISPKTNLVW